jgi:hypothetical protein
MSQQERRANYLRAKREAAVAMIAWLCAIVWTIGVSFWMGRETPAVMLMELPRWIVFGVALPWTACFVFTCWYSLIYLREK